MLNIVAPDAVLLPLLLLPGVTAFTTALVNLGGVVSGTSSPVNATTVGEAAWLLPAPLPARRTAASTV
jgi:hypothetical protein